MRSIPVYLAAVLAGLFIGAAGVCAAVYFWPFESETRTLSALSAIEDADTFSYFLDIPGDTVFATHGGAFPLLPSPHGIALLGEGSVQNSFLLATKFRNAPDGEVVAFGAELEILDENSSLLTGKLMTQTVWSIVEPGRGVLHLYHTENNWQIFRQVLLPMMLSGAPYIGEFLSVNSNGPRPGHRGLIIGGTGEFAGLRGEFIEIGLLRRVTPEGELEGSMELRIVPQRQM